MVCTLHELAFALCTSEGLGLMRMLAMAARSRWPAVCIWHLRMRKHEFPGGTRAAPLWEARHCQDCGRAMRLRAAGLVASRWHALRKSELRATWPSTVS